MGIYKAVQGESFDMVALRVTGDENNVFAIMLSNPQYSNVITFAGGELLTIPMLEQKPAQNSPPWR